MNEGRCGSGFLHRRRKEKLQRILLPHQSRMNGRRGSSMNISLIITLLVGILGGKDVFGYGWDSNICAGCYGHSCKLCPTWQCYWQRRLPLNKKIHRITWLCELQCESCVQVNGARLQTINGKVTKKRTLNEMCRIRSSHLTCLVSCLFHVPRRVNVFWRVNADVSISKQRTCVCMCRNCWLRHSQS